MIYTRNIPTNIINNSNGINLISNSSQAFIYLIYDIHTINKHIYIQVMLSIFFGKKGKTFKGVYLDDHLTNSNEKRISFVENIQYTSIFLGS